MPSDADVDSAGWNVTTVRDHPVVVDGAVIERRYCPPDAQAVADVLAEAATSGTVVTPTGGGTALALGNIPDRVDKALSTRALDAVIDYEPMDLVLSVGAGARFGDVQQLLRGNGQTIPLDPPDFENATIGGLIATARAGPLRRSSGTLRDYLVGMAVAHPSGTVTKSGGMVVKNVTGFDLPRLYHGSLGTLGVIVSANFKVFPLPTAETTLVARADTLDGAMVIANYWNQGPLQPEALELASDAESWLVAARIMGRSGTVTSRVREGGRGIAVPVEAFSVDDSASWWNRYVQGQSFTAAPSEVLVRCTVRPKATPGLVRSLLAGLPAAGAEIVALQAAIGKGTVHVRVVMQGGSATALHALQCRLLDMADHVTILAAPADWKRGIDVWGKEPDGLDLMRSLKEQFDPHRVLNPGRFIGRI
jgi:glycolate oxidase FAD binding subunit